MGKILIVDDEPAIRLVVSSLLRRSGHEVTEADDGCKCLQLLQGMAVDLVITDMQMPNMSGMELMGQVRKRFPDVAIIAMSGHHTPDVLLKIAEFFGPVGIIHKPFEVEALFGAVDAALAKVRQKPGSAG